MAVALECSAEEAHASGEWVPHPGGPNSAVRAEAKDPSHESYNFKGMALSIPHKHFIPLTEEEFRYMGSPKT
jgi:hypothetical protein